MAARSARWKRCSTSENLRYFPRNASRDKNAGYPGPSSPSNSCTRFYILFSQRNIALRIKTAFLLFISPSRWRIHRIEGILSSGRRPTKELSWTLEEGNRRSWKSLVYYIVRILVEILHAILFQSFSLSLLGYIRRIIFVVYFSKFFLLVDQRLFGLHSFEQRVHMKIIVYYCYVIIACYYFLIGTIRLYLLLIDCKYSKKFICL